MERNVGSTDKTARILIGALAGLLSLGILASAVPLPAILAPVLGFASVLLLATGVTGFCGLYGLLGIDTCSVDTR
ncbi:YgaP family membrane protein [Haloarcula marismortui]|uniref:YgaP family membrane protein n=1 Tax=Haloarcula marismortui TaxID=2238 RepID=UPI003C73D9B7